jgi:hypothetical protein
MSLKEIINSKYFKQTLLVVASLAILVFVFSAGVFVGLEKAKFSYGWGENYFRNFAGPGGLPDRPFGGHDPFWDKSYINPHGIFGAIIKINQDSFIISDTHELEIPILVQGDTVIKNHDQNLNISGLKVGDKVIVIGAPDNRGGVAAKLIRIQEEFKNN